MTNSMKAYLTPYIKACGNVLRVGFLGKETGAVSLSPMPQCKVIRTYTDGEQMIKSTFRLSLRAAQSVAGCEDVQPFFHNLAAFLRHNNQNGILPELPGEGFAVSVEADETVRTEATFANSRVFTTDIHLTHYKPIRKDG